MERLDTLVAKQIGVSRSYATKLIEENKVKIGTKILDKPSKKLAPGTKLKIDFNENFTYPALDIKIIYEDDDVIVADKPSGVLTHSKGAFNPEPTLATWLQGKTKDLPKDDQRSGIVHRLDRGTSGVIIMAKNEDARQYLQKQFAKRNVKKTYVALIPDSISPDEAVIDIPIIRNPADPKRFKVSNYGKPAQTAYRMLKSFTRAGQKYSLIELYPKTGRTHQIRLHLKHMKAPIAGDDFYGGIKANRLYLHALKLEITLPDSSRKEFSSALPKDFLNPKIY